jgi:hypothetical protein
MPVILSTSAMMDTVVPSSISFCSLLTEKSLSPREGPLMEVQAVYEDRFALFARADRRRAVPLAAPGGTGGRVRKEPPR